jgi:hypothetical protein
MIRGVRGRLATLLALGAIAGSLAGPAAAPAVASSTSSTPSWSVIGAPGFVASATALAPASRAWAPAPARDTSPPGLSAVRLSATALRSPVDAAPRLTGWPTPVVAAVDGLDVTAATTYTVDPAARKVRVSIDIVGVNRLPVTPGARYYYPGINLAVQPEAAQASADEQGVRDRVTSAARDGYRLLMVQFATRLYSGGTVHLHLAYVLPAGAPRSTSSVRVGLAYTTFMAWAFGDHGTVTVNVPAAFSVDAAGEAMNQASGQAGEHVLTASAASPGSWYAWIDARNDAALTSQTLKLPAGEQVVVRAWPEDPVWQRRVSQALTSGIPALVQRIGLPWPVNGQLTVEEVAGALLEGYAGFYSPDSHQITISENLDPLTIVHEASHAWFGASLFTDRWITEGLADEYAFRTLKGLGVSVDGPPAVRTSAAAAFPLDAWGPPAAISSKAQDAKEQWGYDASWTVVREVVSEVGEPGMRRVFAAAAAGTTAYPGAGTPEKSALPADWRRFVDLAEEVGGGKGIAEMIAPWALTPADRALLAPRAAARSAYHTLEAQDGDWAAPAVVRMSLDGWDFATASDAIGQAEAAVHSRDAIRTQAAALGLTVPASLRDAYQSASTAGMLAKAANNETALLDALGAVDAADAASAAPRDWIVELGLLGQDPSAALATARSAWEAGDAVSAAQSAASVRDELAGAAVAGQQRVLGIGVGLLVMVLSAIAIGLVVRRRAARRRLALANATATAGPDAPSRFEAPTGLSEAAAATVAVSPMDETQAISAAGPPDADRPLDADGPLSADGPIAPPAPPSGWAPPVGPTGWAAQASGTPAGPLEPYPMLPESAAGEPPKRPPSTPDEGAQ